MKLKQESEYEKTVPGFWKKWEREREREREREWWDSREKNKTVSIKINLFPPSLEYSDHFWWFLVWKPSRNHHGLKWIPIKTLSLSLKKSFSINNLQNNFFLYFWYFLLLLLRFFTIFSFHFILNQRRFFLLFVVKIV